MADSSLLRIFILAIIAVFILIRLRSVIGRRTGNERKHPDPFRTIVDGRIRFPDMSPEPFAVINHHDEPRSLEAGLSELAARDPGFDEATFLKGAREAFRWIVSAYAKGDRETLRPLLAPSVYKEFEGAINSREASGNRLEAMIAPEIEAEIVEASARGAVAIVKVRFRSSQTNTLYSSDSSIIDGAPDQWIDVVDTWSFVRDMQSKDPNWQLIETKEAPQS